MTDWKKLANNAIKYGGELDEHPENLASLLLLAARFPELHPLNLIFLHLQCPEAQYLRPAAAWMNEKISMKNSQWMIRLYQFVNQTEFLRDGKYVSLHEATPEERYQLETGRLAAVKKERPVPMAYFDITQTRLPEQDYLQYLETPLSALDSDQLREGLLHYSKDLGLKVATYQFMSPLMRSYFDPKETEIQLSYKLSPKEQIPALLHELATATLIQTSTEKTVPQIREIEIETLYAGLCRKCGLDPGEPFVRNLRSLCRDMDTDQIDLNQSFLRIGKALHFTVQGVEESVRQLHVKQQETAPEKEISENFMREL